MPSMQKNLSLTKKIAYNPVVKTLVDVLKAFIPGILANLISDILGRGLHIDTPEGTILVLSTAIASFFVYLSYRNWSGIAKYVKPDSYINGKIEAEIQMEGNLYTLALFIQNMCISFLTVPLHPKTLLYILIPLIPALEAAAASMLLSSNRRNVQNFISNLIFQLVSSNQMVTERSITKIMKEKFPNKEYQFIPEQLLRPIIRNQMVNYLEAHEYRLYDSKLIINTSEFDNWKIRRVSETQNTSP